MKVLILSSTHLPDAALHGTWRGKILTCGFPKVRGPLKGVPFWGDPRNKDST